MDPLSAILYFRQSLPKAGAVEAWLSELKLFIISESAMCHLSAYNVCCWIVVSVPKPQLDLYYCCGDLSGSL